MASILVVDEDDMVRQLARRVLEAHGHAVLTAANGTQAMNVCEERPGEIALVVCAARLPDMLGRELVKLASCSQPAMRALYTAGTSEPPPAGDFVARPFTAEQLAAKVQGALGPAEDGS